MFRASEIAGVFPRHGSLSTTMRLSVSRTTVTGAPPHEEHGPHVTESGSVGSGQLVADEEAASVDLHVRLGFFPLEEESGRFEAGPSRRRCSCGWGRFPGRRGNGARNPCAGRFVSLYGAPISRPLAVRPDAARLKEACP